MLHIDSGMADGGEAFSERLWRRYGEHAFAVIDEIRRDPASAELLIEGPVTRCAR